MPPTANIVDAQGVGTIRNDDPIPSISVQPALAVEGSAQPLTATLTVRLSAASGQQVSVAFQTADATATDGVGEIDPTTPPVAAPSCSPRARRERTITIALRNDLVVEADELLLRRPDGQPSMPRSQHLATTVRSSTTTRQCASSWRWVVKR